jgi:hypothetical protein
MKFEEGNDGIPGLVAFTTAGLAYGTIHGIAWQAPFTGVTQELLWRISAVVVASLGPIMLLLWPLSVLVDRLPYDAKNVPKIFSNPPNPRWSLLHFWLSSPLLSVICSSTFVFGP